MFKMKIRFTRTIAVDYVDPVSEERDSMPFQRGAVVNVEEIESISEHFVNIHLSLGIVLLDVRKDCFEELKNL